MDAYLVTLIEGNESFGGYLSVDGDPAFKVEHDMTYRIRPGRHYLVIYSNSNFERAIENGSGDRWEIDVFVELGQAIKLSILSRGNTLVTAPLYEVVTLDDDTNAYFEEVFAEIDRKEEEEKNKPRRSPKMIVWGSIIMSVCGIGFLSMFAALLGGETEILAPMLVFAGGLVGGIVMFMKGLQKKVRR